MSDARPRDLSRLKPLSTLELRFVPLDYVIHWDRCGLAADYMAAHLAYTFEKRDTARTVLSTVANELIENAVKFSADKSQPASISLNHFGEWLAIETRNRTEARRAHVLEALMRDIEAQSAESAFLSRIANPSGTEGSSSGLGLLVLKKDYGVRLFVQIEPGTDGFYDVVVQAVIDSAELEAQ